jgi:hypothetical protein
MVGKDVPSAVRDDYDPHRGRALTLLGLTSLVLAFSSCLLFTVGLLGIAVGGVACLLAATDLRDMAAGDVDPSGREPTGFALIAGLCGIAYSLLGMTLWLACFGPLYSCD